MQLRNLETTTNRASDLTFSNSTGFKNSLQQGLKVYVQSFRGLPLKVRVQDDWNEWEENLPEQFQEAADEVIQLTGTSEKYGNCWFFYGYRHGNLFSVAQLVIDEITSTIDDQAIEQWKRAALKNRQLPVIHSISWIRSYLRLNPLAFQNLRNTSQQTQPPLFSFQFFSDNPSHDDSQFDNIASIIKAMNHPSPTLRKHAIQFFTNLCDKRIDRFQPFPKK